MAAQEYVEGFLTQNGIDWLQMQGSEDLAIVEFLEHPVKMLRQLEDVGKDVFSEIRMVACTGRKCTFAIRVAPHQLEAPTLSDAFAELARSTAEFHARFETDKHSDLRDARVVMNEEFSEVWREIDNVAFYNHGTENLAKELADLLVTMLGVAAFAGISEADLIEALLDTARKNDDKTLQNCTWYQGKVTRNEKLPRDGA